MPGTRVPSGSASPAPAVGRPPAAAAPVDLPAPLPVLDLPFPRAFFRLRTKETEATGQEVLKEEEVRTGRGRQRDVLSRAPQRQESWSDAG